jgi:tetratricopeptide (TPR) repeat protein
MTSVAALCAALFGAAPTDSQAASHREAPLIAFDPAADLTDVYAFVSYDEALSWAEKALSDRPNHPPALQAAAACLAVLGRQQDAEAAARRNMAADPAFRIGTLRDNLPYQNAEHFARWVAAFRKAGLPE